MELRESLRCMHCHIMESEDVFFQDKEAAVVVDASMATAATAIYTPVARTTSSTLSSNQQPLETAYHPPRLCSF